MEPERTLLQQIRDKEQELGGKVEAVKEEAEATVAAVRSEAEDLLCTADRMAKAAAEELYWKERGKTEIQIEMLNKAADGEREAGILQGEKNRAAAVSRIIRYVTGG